MQVLSPLSQRPEARERALHGRSFEYDVGADDPLEQGS